MHLLFWVHKSQITKKRTAPINMRITIDGKRAEVKTGISIEPESWDNQKQKITGDTVPVKEMNDTLLHFTGLALSHYNDCLRRNITVSAALIRNMILKKNEPVHTLLQVFTYHINNLQARVGFDISENTVKKYKTVETKLKLFLSRKMNRTDINLSEMNHRFITDLDLYMKVEENLKQNAVVKNMQQFKRVIRVCIENGWLEKKPVPEL